MGFSGVNKVIVKTTGCIPARIVLSIITFVGCINLYMVRVNLSVIIVEMVRPGNDGEEAVNQSSNCISQTESSTGNQSLIEVITGNETESKLFNKTYYENTGESTSGSTYNDDRFDWDELTQGIILASFFYGYAVTQIIGGRLAEKFGGKLVFGICILSGGISAVLTPTVSRWNVWALVALRTLQGALQGVAWPALHVLLVRWIPPLERGKFIAYVYNANVIGTTITLPMCGLIIKAYGWPAAFYITGGLSLVWCVWWFSFVYDFPADHPRISHEEKAYLETVLRASGTSDVPPPAVPWKKIITSLPVWANFLADIGNSFGFSLCVTHIPTYMKNILGYSIAENGLLSATPFISRYIGGILYSSIGDWLLGRNLISITNNRKLFSAIAMFGPALMVIGVAYSGCKAPMAVVFLCLTFFFNGAVSTSLFVNHCDLAPNFSGTLMGITNTGASVMAFVAPVIAGALTNNQQTVTQWRKLFWLCIPIYSLPEIFFLIFASGDVQPWNYPPSQDQKEPSAEELSLKMPFEGQITSPGDDTDVANSASSEKIKLTESGTQEEPHCQKACA